MCLWENLLIRKSFAFKDRARECLMMAVSLVGLYIRDANFYIYPLALSHPPNEISPSQRTLLLSRHIYTLSSTTHNQIKR